MSGAGLPTHLAMSLGTKPPLRYLWAAPATAAGLVAAGVACALGATARVVDGVLEVAGGRLCSRVGSAPASFAFVAITLGHVVIGQDHAVLDGLRAHEHEHVRQYERWGPFMLPAYFASSLLAWRRGDHFYFDNAFEKEAYGESG